MELERLEAKGVEITTTIIHCVQFHGSCFDLCLKHESLSSPGGGPTKMAKTVVTVT